MYVDYEEWINAAIKKIIVFLFTRFNFLACFIALLFICKYALEIYTVIEVHGCVSKPNEPPT